MRIIADTHIHVYPSYDLVKVRDTLLRNLESCDSGAVKLAFLAERFDCHFFKEIQNGALESYFDKVEVVTESGSSVAVMYDGEMPVLSMFPGRQIVTSERIEVLALTSDLDLEDGLSSERVIKTILDANAIPVLSWAPGKWFFSRGAVVRKLLDHFGSDKLLIGDTILRPNLYATPLLFRYARRRGHKIIFGTDPLPISGEESYMGSYATLMEGAFDARCPVSSVRHLFHDASTVMLPKGIRCNVLDVYRRLRSL